MQITWNNTLVLLSIAVAIIGSFTSLTHAQRMRASSGLAATVWMWVGAITLGLTIWSMHFIGMLASHLSVILSFDTTLTLFSAVPSIAAALLGFYSLRQAVIATRKIILVGIIMGAGITTMHYTGMEALEMSHELTYNPVFIALSIVIAIISCWGSLLMMYRGEQLNLSSQQRFILGSLIMGIAISGMHYTAMQGLGMHMDHMSDAQMMGAQLDRNLLALIVALTCLLWFGGASVAALLDQRMMSQNAEALNQLRLANAQLEKSANEKALEMTKELRKSEEKVRAVIDAALDCIITIDSNGNIVEFNTTAERTFGHKRADVIGKNMGDLIIPERDRAHHNAGMQRYLNTGLSHVVGKRIELSAMHADGTEFPVELAILGLKLNNEHFFTGFLRDITSLKQAQADIHSLAFYDPLTNLPNRRLLQDRLRHALSSNVQHTQHSAILFIDLDNFKTLNDTRGHAIGDLLLVEAASRLVSAVRSEDSVARVGGDEFIVLLEGLSEHIEQASAQVKVIGEKIAQTLNLPYSLESQEHFSSPSIGICLFSNQTDAQALTVDELLKRADTAMYQAKHAGRNTIRFFDPAMQADLEARSLLEQDLRQALAKNQFELHYQPQVNSANQVIGAEALLRWVHPVRGGVPPAQFIPLAEETGLILPIGQWVLETACKQLKAWEQHPNTADLQLAVNISARQFRQSDFVTQLQLILHDTGAAANKLKLEMTESLVLDNVEDSIEKMQTLLNLNIQFSMDDFGTGYSSLTYLKRFPLSQLKIDKSFIHDVTLDTHDEAIIKAIIGMAHTLGIEVVAEGVETEAQLHFLMNNGCQIFQGYLFSKPISATAFDQLLKGTFNATLEKNSANQKPNPALH